jgi:hypothetical protein
MKPRFYSTALAVPAVRPKSLAAIIAVAGALFGVTPSQAATVTWDFTGLTDGTVYTSPHAFASTSGSPTQNITVYGYVGSTATNLYGKNLSGDEKGLGLVGTTDNELNFSSTNQQYIEISVSSLTGYNNNHYTGSLSFGFDSTNMNGTINESWAIYGSNTLGGALGSQGATLLASCTNTGGTTGSNCESIVTLASISGYQYFDVAATAGNVLFAEFNANISAVPLPAALPLFASGLAGLGLLGWRRKRKALAA